MKQVQEMKWEGIHKRHNSLAFFLGNSLLEESIAVEGVHKDMRDN